MNLKSLTDAELVNLGKEKSALEKALTLETIKIIREIDRRSLYLTRGYPSLYEFVVGEFGYEPASAYRRIQAARLLQEIPEVENRIIESKLSLTNVARAQTFFRKDERLTGKRLETDEKIKILDMLEQKSTRDAEKVLVAQFPDVELHNKDILKPVSAHEFQVKVILDEATVLNLDRLNKLISHQNPDLSYSALIGKLIDIAIKFYERKGTWIYKQETQRNIAEDSNKKNYDANFLPAPEGSSRHIPSGLRKIIWRRDDGECAYIDRLTGKRCRSTYQLEVHHNEAFAFGGKHTPDNLQLLCRNHNKFYALKDNLVRR